MDQGEINLEYCPTEQIWSDIFTKHLQGQQFRMMRAMVMNCPVDPGRNESQMMITKNNSVILSQECVGLQPKLPPTILQSKDRPKI